MPAARAFSRSPSTTSQERPPGASRAGSWGMTSASTNARTRSRRSACSRVGLKDISEDNPALPQAKESSLRLLRVDPGRLGGEGRTLQARQDVVERLRWAHHRFGLRWVRTVVASELRRRALDRQQLT